jgi:hypothetical protein
MICGRHAKRSRVQFRPVAASTSSQRHRQRSQPRRRLRIHPPPHRPGHHRQPRNHENRKGFTRVGDRLTARWQFTTTRWLLKYLRNYRIHLHWPLPGVTPIHHGVEPHLTCCLSLPAHRGRPVVLGGIMELRTCDHLMEDGIYCQSPALRGRNYCYFHINIRVRRLNRSNYAPNPLRLNILPISHTGSIFCPDFRLSPLMFSIFYEQGGGG